jgi:hypothetical protein
MAGTLPIAPLGDPDRPGKIRRATEEFLRREQSLHDQVSALTRAYYELQDLIPQTVEKLFSGHFFPFSESTFELANSSVLVQEGFYRYAFVGLRSVLELGLLSVYWDRKDKAEEDILGWLKAVEPTPFKNEILAGLRSISTVTEFEKSFDLGKLIGALYGSLSDFAHVRGYRYSSRGLNRGSNILQFNEDSFRAWANELRQVVGLVTTVHLLKYPVGLQHTPLDQKFGLNGPAGGFLNPWQADRLRAVLNPAHLAVLQEISDRDPNAQEMAAWVNDLPDISDEDFERQAFELNQDLIRGQGFESWYESEAQTYRSVAATDPAAWARFEERAAKLRAWAKENGVLTGPTVYDRPPGSDTGPGKPDS